MLFLPPNQQHQSTEGLLTDIFESSIDTEAAAYLSVLSFEICGSYNYSYNYSILFLCLFNVQIINYL